MTHRLSVKTSRRAELVEITSEIAAVVAKSGITDGLCTIFVHHTTAGITINENADPSVAQDMLTHLEKLVPRSKEFLHREGNSDSHIKASLVGSSVTVPVESGYLLLGNWQGIYLCEFDGPRTRTALLTVTAAHVS